MAGVKKFWRPNPQALDQIYNAAFDSTAFDALASTVAGAMESPNSVVVLARDGGPIELSTTTSQAARRAYLEYYNKIDIWAFPPARDLMVTRSEEWISDEAVLNSEFYHDYARHLGMWHPMGVTCMAEPDLVVALGVNRTPRSAPFRKADEARFLELTGHVKRAVQLRRHFQNVSVGAQAGYATLDTLAFAATVVDSTGRVIFANAAAEIMNRANVGLTICRGRLSCTVPGQARNLGELVRKAANGGAGGGIRLTNASGTGALLALVAPMPNRLAESRDGFGFALVAVREAKDSPGFPESLISQIFGLSRSEAQVVCAVVAGATLEEIANQRGVKITTIRTQIEAAFRKTDTESQRDLLRLIASLPQLRQGRTP